MAKFRAVTRIKYGAPAPTDEAGDQVGDSKIHEFEPGQIVTGLPKEEMAKLWDVGALEQVETFDEPAPEGGSDG